MIERKSSESSESGQSATDVTFTLPPGHPSAGTSVSVVGDFNDWDPAAHTFGKFEDGSRAITVSLPVGERVCFRYLADAGQWYDEPEADGHDGQNNYLDL
jgi:1,4-alpha-glucan branching enzyme